MKPVTVSITTRDYVGPAGPDLPFLFTLHNHDTSVSDLQQKVMAMSARFEAVPAGDYTASVAKMGTQVTQDFTVADDTQTFQIPDTMTVQVGDPVPAPAPDVPPAAPAVA